MPTARVSTIPIAKRGWGATGRPGWTGFAAKRRRSPESKSRREGDPPHGDPLLRPRRVAAEYGAAHDGSGTRIVAVEEPGGLAGGI